MKEINKEAIPRKYPQEFPDQPEHYTKPIVAIDRIELGGPLDFYNQLSDYQEGNKAAPDNNIHFENRSNPLSSKGN